MATEKDGRARDALQQRIDLTKAKLELDQDELETVKTDLIRSGADRLSRIQRQFNRHEATQKEYETNNPPTAIDKNRTAEGSASAIAEMSAWKSLRERAVRLQHAMEDARQVAAKLRESHKGLQSQVDMEVSNKEAITEQARSGIAASTGSDSSSTSTATSATCFCS